MMPYCNLALQFAYLAAIYNRKVVICLTALVLSSCDLQNKPLQNNSGIPAQPVGFDWIDTIPKVAIRDTSLAFPQIFEGSFKPETKVSQLGVEITFDMMAAGNLNIPSGKIIATDPLTLSNAVAFKEQFPIGEFPVELAMANINGNKDRRVAFARIKFSDNPVKQWEFALLPGQLPISIKSTDRYGYGVDAGIGLFVDQIAQNSLDSILDQKWEEIFSEEFEVYKNYAFQNHKAVFYSTGYGDGFYTTYIGRDSVGKISQLLTDFGIVLWWNIGK